MKNTDGYLLAGYLLTTDGLAGWLAAGWLAAGWLAGCTGWLLGDSLGPFGPILEDSFGPCWAQAHWAH